MRTKKAIFIIFKGLSVSKNYLRLESAPISSSSHWTQQQSACRRNELSILFPSSPGLNKGCIRDFSHYFAFDIILKHTTKRKNFPGFCVILRLGMKGFQRRIYDSVKYFDGIFGKNRNSQWLWLLQWRIYFYCITQTEVQILLVVCWRLTMTRSSRNGID